MAEEEDLIDNGFEEVDPIDENPDIMSKVLGEKEDNLRKGSDDIENIEKQKDNVNETVGLTGRSYLQYLKVRKLLNLCCILVWLFFLNNLSFLLIQYFLEIQF